ncbi:MAG TPA: hypothetical protein VMH78_04965 [Thermoplasmata archaeon]|nr:hypothetical protein [Thermoplasmata archaeon]
MDVNTVLLSVRERDKWRDRLALLERTLNEVREQRRRLSDRLRRLKREISRLGDYSDAIIEPARRYSQGGTIGAASPSRIPPR